MAEMTTPILFMKQLMYKLSNTYQDDSNKLNLALADLTNISGKTQITDWTQLRDMIKADITTNLNNGGTAKDFLKNYCNIDLDNEDCGALIGYDCSGGEILTNDNIINEEGNLQTHPATATIRGCTISFPTYSDSTYNYVMDGLYTWWIGLPFDLVKESFGLEFNENSYVTSMPVDLYNDPPSGGLATGAYVSTWYNSDNIATALSLNINMNDAAYGTIIIGDKSGNTTDGWFAALDRILAHELTHAVMSTDIRGFGVWLPKWFKEGGTAELVNGCDDSRTSALSAAAVNTSIIDDGFSDNPSNANEYSVGFIAMRYLLKKYTDRQVHIHFPVKPKEPFEKVWEKMAHGIRSEHCISRDGDLNKIMDEFVDFCQRDDYNLVQPWTLCSNEGSKTLRIPLEGHEHKIEDEICTFAPIANAQEIFDSIHAVILSDTLYAHQGKVVSEGTLPQDAKIEVHTFPSYSMRAEYSDVPPAVGIQGRDFELFVNGDLVPGEGSSDSSGIGYFDSYGSFDPNNYEGRNTIWCCEELTSVHLAVGSVFTVVVEKYRNCDRPNIIVCLSADTFYYCPLRGIAQLARAVKNANRGGKVQIFPSFRYKMMDFYVEIPSFLQDVIDFVAEFKHTYPTLADVVELNTSWYEMVGWRNPLNLTGVTRNLRIYTPSALLKTVRIGAVTYQGLVGADVPENELYSVFGNYLVGVKGDKEWEISSKKDTDFPCFYLSTGVFKPSTWNGQGLTYPSSAVSNVNDEYIPFNIHVLNDYRMRFDLQGMGTCKKVTGKQGDADILNGIRQTGQYSYESDKISDLIPGIGCPLIVRSVENKAIYNTILCYFTKTDYSGTFTLIFYDEHDEEKPPIFQSVAFGLGITEEESYKYPLYTAGGTSGLYPAHYSFSYMPGPMAREPVTLHIYGNEFNFDMEKGDTLDSLLYPVATNRCGISNFRVLQPDGRWKSVINLRQVFYQGGDNTCGAYITKNNGNNVKDYLVYPTISDTTSVDRYTLVQPITVIKKHIDGEDESGFLMSINGVKCKPDRLRSMFSALDGHEYLIVPNGWYDRTLGLPLINSMSITEIMDLIQKMPKQTYVLCVDLG